MPRRLRLWLREPLARFLLAGIALFGGYRAIHPETGGAGSAQPIELTTGDLRQLVVAWQARGRAAPSAAELQDLIEARVREEVLYREALRLGLDRDDTIVRRRLAQKMGFLAEGASEREPTRAELLAFFEAHPERFRTPGRVTFHHLYFSPDRRGPEARADADRARGELAGKSGAASEAAALGDPFMFRDFYGDRPEDEIAGVFGKSFAHEVLRLSPGSWQGPIASGYGWHLVWPESIAPARIPDFDEVESEVRARWLDDQRADAQERAFQGMRARYEVVLPGADDRASLGAER